LVKIKDEVLGTLLTTYATSKIFKEAEENWFKPKTKLPLNLSSQNLFHLL
jgi:hypothetical protein